MPFLACICAFIFAAAAAAAAAGSIFFLSAEEGLIGPADDIGLRLRRLSDFLEEGERERRSNLEARLGSGGSVWSKRERLRGSPVMLGSAGFDGGIRWV